MINNLKNKRFALVYGQSIEGCGVSRNGSEFQHWFNKNGIELTVYSYDERTYNRRDAHELNFKSFMRDDIGNIVNELNQYDAVLFNSYPSNKFNKESIIDFYEKLIKKITTIKVGFMHELNKTNIDKVPYLVGIMNQMDIIYNFSEETWFAQTISQMLPSKKIGNRVKKFTMWFNFDLLENYRNTISLSDKEKKLLYIGRWTTMKDPRRVLDLGPMLLEHGIEPELMGIERSIGAKFDIFDHPNIIDRTGKKEKIGETGCVPVYGTYIRDEGMEKLANSLFGCSFYRMPKTPENYGNRMEYTQIETIAVGSIPVFDEDWGINNKTKDGKRYIDIPYSAIYSNKEDLQGTVDKLYEVANNIDLQKKYRETSYKIAKSEFDADIVIPEMFNDILNIGKDNDIFTCDEDLIRHFITGEGQDEFINLYRKYNSDGEIVVLGIRELFRDKEFCILDGKKEKRIKRFK